MCCWPSERRSKLALRCLHGTKHIDVPFAHNASFDAVGMVCVTERVERYRRNAEKCLEVAQSFNDPGAKRALLVIGECVAYAGGTA